MSYLQNGGIWKIGLLILAAVMNYGARFFSDKLFEEEDKKTKAKIIFKTSAFVLAVFAAIAVMFL